MLVLRKNWEFNFTFPHGDKVPRKSFNTFSILLVLLSVQGLCSLVLSKPPSLSITLKILKIITKKNNFSPSLYKWILYNHKTRDSSTEGYQFIAKCAKDDFSGSRDRKKLFFIQ